MIFFFIKLRIFPGEYKNYNKKCDEVVKVLFLPTMWDMDVSKVVLWIVDSKFKLKLENFIPSSWQDQSQGGNNVLIETSVGW